jgi:saccharopine dehydrogenase (NAD+, L-lysine forming)
MRILVVGAGGVGAALASIAARRDVFEHIVLADIDGARAQRAAAMAQSDRVSGTHVDAGDRIDLTELIRSTRADVVVNACDPRFNPPIFDAAFAAGTHYLDMAMHMSKPHPTDPYNQVGVLLGSEQHAVVRARPIGAVCHGCRAWLFGCRRPLRSGPPVLSYR